MLKKYTLFAASLIGSFAIASIASLASATEQNLDLTDYEALKQYEGKIVYVDFWASWCGPCRQSFPWMNNIQTEFSDSDFVVVGINVDEEHEDAEEFLEQYPANFDVVFDPKGELAAAFEVPGMPSSYVFDRSGKLINSHIGFNDEAANKLHNELASLINQPSKPKQTTQTQPASK